MTPFEEWWNQFHHLTNNRFDAKALLTGWNACEMRVIALILGDHRIDEDVKRELIARIREGKPTQ